MKYTDLANTIQNKKNDFENISNENEAIDYVLREYKTLCNSLDFDYEFHYVDDIKNDSGAEFELVNFFKKYGSIRYIANTDYIDCNDGDDENNPYQVEVMLYNPTTNDDESCVYQFFFKTIKIAKKFEEEINKLKTYNDNIVQSIYKSFACKRVIA